MENRIGRNMFLNIVKTFISIVFPLITYPYATRVLGVTNFGKVSYGSSIISYFTLISGLGISSYAIREGGYLRANKVELEKFANNLFTLNVISTLFTYVAFFISIFTLSKFSEYKVLLIIQSLTFFFLTIGVDWLNVIFEDYFYIATRSICVQVVTLVLLFVLVKAENDYLMYAIIQVGSYGLIAIVNLQYIRKKIKLRLCRPIILKHLKPVMILFSNNIAVSIYCNLDITMIGWIWGDYQVGLYSLTAKIYTILKQLIAAAYSVTVTRLAEYYNQEKKELFIQLLNDTLLNVLTLSIPIGVGGYLLSDVLLYLIGGDNYIEAKGALQILCITSIIAVLGGALAYCINMPLRREKNNLISTVVGAIENLLLNIILIKTYGILGAAWTTLFAEITVLFILLITMKQFLYLLNIKYLIVNTLKTLLICSFFPILSFLIESKCDKFSFEYICFMIITCMLEFGVLGIVLKNQGIINLLNIIKRKEKIK